MLRRRMLPAGWYPETKEETLEQISSWRTSDTHDAVSVVVPHAGWFFSGELAYLGISALAKSDIIVVAGGHLSQDASLLCITEEELETPLGNLKTDTELIKKIQDNLSAKADIYPDNTVEIMLPLIKYSQPDARIAGLRCPPSPSTVKKLAQLIFDYANKNDIRLAIVGSTDLTHYGPQYSFAPAGTGKRAQQWVKEENDKAIIDALSAMDTDSALSLAQSRLSACSAGGACLAAEYARLCGKTAGKVLAYRQSSDIYPSDSFVGYVTIAYL